MPASRPGVLQPLPSPSHSRSRGGAKAGFSDQPGRRNLHTASSTRPSEEHQSTSRMGQASTSGVLPPEFVRAAKRLLERQRDFRVDQLSHLVAVPDATSRAVRHEVRDRARAAARAALTDIEEALRRIEQGSYGGCDACGARLSHPRLAAVPMARMCSACQRAVEEDTADVRPLQPGGCSMVGTNR